MIMADLFNDNGATFSECRQYRFALWRTWDSMKPKVMFIGLNPSKADESKTDATITTVCRYARDWGYGGVIMCNLFAYVSTDPRALLIDQQEKIGYNNNNYLKNYGSKAGLIIFAWGAFNVNGRDKEVIEMFPDAHVIAFNNNGTPHHPLRLKANLKPSKYKT
jgi:hypothetical protein